VPPIVEAHDLIHALNADIQDAAVLGERLRVEPTLQRERQTVGPEHRRQLKFGNSRWTRSLVDDFPTQPAPPVADGNEAGAIGRDTQSGKSAKALLVRNDFDAAAEF